jgi:hypothetical protein
MKNDLRNGPSFWRTVRLLLGAARKRATGRQKRQQELLQSRSGKNATNWAGFGFALAVLFMVVLNVFAAFAVSMAVDSGERIEAERRGKIVVSRSFLDAAEEAFASSSRPDDSIAPSPLLFLGGQGNSGEVWWCGIGH